MFCFKIELCKSAKGAVFTKVYVRTFVNKKVVRNPKATFRSHLSDRTFATKSLLIYYRFQAIKKKKKKPPDGGFCFLSFNLITLKKYVKFKFKIFF